MIFVIIILCFGLSVLLNKLGISLFVSEMKEQGYFEKLKSYFKKD